MPSNGDRGTHNRLRSYQLQDAWDKGKHENPAEIQRDIERTQSEIASTLDEIQKRVRPSALIEDLRGYFMGYMGGTNEFMGNLGRTVRENPVPVVLTGIGLLWLGLGERRSHESRGSSIDTEAAKGRVKGMAQGAKHRASDAAHSVKDAGRYAKEQASTLSHRARDASHRASSGVQEQYTEHPLVMGALAFAVGALFGSVAPTTRAEEEALSGVSERISVKARQLAREQMQRAEDFAKEKGREAHEASDSPTGEEGSSSGSSEPAGFGAAPVARSEPSIYQRGEHQEPSSGMPFVRGPQEGEGGYSSP